MAEQYSVSSPIRESPSQSPDISLKENQKFEDPVLSPVRTLSLTPVNELPIDFPVENPSSSNNSRVLSPNRSISRILDPRILPAYSADQDQEVLSQVIDEPSHIDTKVDQHKFLSQILLPLKAPASILIQNKGSSPVKTSATSATDSFFIPLEDDVSSDQVDSVSFLTTQKVPIHLAGNQSPVLIEDTFCETEPDLSDINYMNKEGYESIASGVEDNNIVDDANENQSLDDSIDTSEDQDQDWKRGEKRRSKSRSVSSERKKSRSDDEEMQVNNDEGETEEDKSGGAVDSYSSKTSDPAKPSGVWRKGILKRRPADLQTSLLPEPNIKRGLLPLPVKIDGPFIPKLRRMHGPEPVIPSLFNDFNPHIRPGQFNPHMGPRHFNPHMGPGHFNPHMGPGQFNPHMRHGQFGPMPNGPRHHPYQNHHGLLPVPENRNPYNDDMFMENMNQYPYVDHPSDQPNSGLGLLPLPNLAPLIPRPPPGSSLPERLARFFSKF